MKHGSFQGDPAGSGQIRFRSNDARAGVFGCPAAADAVKGREHDPVGSFAVEPALCAGSALARSSADSLSSSASSIANRRLPWLWAMRCHFKPSTLSLRRAYSADQHTRKAILGNRAALPRGLPKQLNGGWLLSFGTPVPLNSAMAYSISASRVIGGRRGPFKSCAASVRFLFDAAPLPCKRLRAHIVLWVSTVCGLPNSGGRRAQDLAEKVLNLQGITGRDYRLCPPHLPSCCRPTRAVLRRHCRIGDGPPRPAMRNMAREKHGFPDHRGSAAALYHSAALASSRLVPKGHWHRARRSNVIALIVALFHWRAGSRF